MRTDTDNLQKAFAAVYAKPEQKQQIDESTDKKMTVGKHKSGDELEGKTKEMMKNSGPESAEGVEKADEAPELQNLRQRSKKHVARSAFASG